MKYPTRLLAVLAVLAVLGLATAARAQVKVAEGLTHGEGLYSSLDYGVSDRYDRAWLVLHYTYQANCTTSDGECTFDEPQLVHLDGLTYDQARHQIRYQAAGSDPVVCATVQPRGREEIARPTGLCGTEVRSEKAFVDDGFSGHEVRGRAILFRAQAVRSVAQR